MKKAKAKHTIVHDGQSLAPGTVFECPDKLYDELLKQDAIEAPKDDSKVEAVKLKPQTPAPALVPAGFPATVYAPGAHPGAAPFAAVPAPISRQTPPPHSTDNDGLGK